MKTRVRTLINPEINEYARLFYSLPEILKEEGFDDDKIELQHVGSAEERFEAGEMPASIAVTTEDESTYTVEKDDFRCHPNNPMDWEDLEAKFHAVVPDGVDRSRRADIVESVKRIDDRGIDELLALLSDSKSGGTV